MMRRNSRQQPAAMIRRYLSTRLCSRSSTVTTKTKPTTIRLAHAGVAIRRSSQPLFDRSRAGFRRRQFRGWPPSPLSPPPPCASSSSPIGAGAYAAHSTRYLHHHRQEQQQQLQLRQFSATAASKNDASVRSGASPPKDGADAAAADAAASASSSPTAGTTEVPPFLPTRYLQAIDETNYDPITFQRRDIPYDLQSGKPDLARYSKSAGTRNNAQQQPPPPTSLLQRHYDQWTGAAFQRDRVLWSGWTEETVRSSEDLSMTHRELCGDAQTSAAGMKKALRALYRYGILLVTGTPVQDGGAGVAALGSALGGGRVKNRTTVLRNYRAGGTEIVLPHGTDGPMRTLYGTVWSTTSSGQADGASVADSAYGCDGLPLHTDMTYLRDPPGLQVFAMIRPAPAGGESVFADGFAAAERLRRRHPRAFQTLSQTVRRYRSIDAATGWHLEASGPVISVYRKGGMDVVVGIRHNDLDRLPDLPPVPFQSDDNDSGIDEFYDRLEEAHYAWDTILSDDDLRLEISLREGDAVVVANQRCFHARKSFEASSDQPRSVTGCYVSADELFSRFRMEGYDVY